MSADLMTPTPLELALLLFLCAAAVAVLTPSLVALGRSWRARAWVRRAWRAANALPASWTVQDVERARELRMDVLALLHEAEELRELPLAPGDLQLVEDVHDRLTRHAAGLELQTRHLLQLIAGEGPTPTA